MERLCGSDGSSCCGSSSRGSSRGSVDSVGKPRRRQPHKLASMSAPDLESPAKRLERAAMSKRGSVSGFTIQPLDGKRADTAPEVAKEKRRRRRREKQQLRKDAAASVGLPPIAHIAGGNITSVTLAGNGKGGTGMVGREALEL